MIRSTCAGLCVFWLISFAFAQEYVPGEVIVKLKGKAGSSTVNQFMGGVGQKMALKASFGKLNMYHFAFKAESMDVKAKVNELQQDPSVEYAEPNYILRKSEEDKVGLLSAPMTREQALQQVQSQSTDGLGSYTQSSAATQVSEAWSVMSSLASNPERPVVAVIDTGVDLGHSVFGETQALWVNPNEIPSNGVDDDNNGYIDDVQGWNFVSNTNNPNDDDGHGTHVAGIIIGTTTDIFSNVLSTSRVRIMPLKFLAADGSGSTSNAIRAIYYAVNNGAKVLNNSWGGGSYSQALAEAIAFSYNQKVAFVAAAGNAGKNNDTTSMYPANYDVPHVIAVAASNDWDYLASFSDYGLSKVHLSAPGVAILSTLPNETFGYLSGTSMATPFVSGVAALVSREAPELTGYQIKSILLQGVDKSTQLSGKVVTGGRINAKSSVILAQGDSRTLAYQPEYSAGVSSSNRELASDISSTGSTAGCGTVATMSEALRYNGSGRGDSPQPPGVLVLLLMLVPMVMWRVLRGRAPVQRRKFDRFIMNSQVKVMVGERELVGNLSTISMGGASFNADALLEKGGIVTMKIEGPNGQEQIEVQGRIVWNEANKAYGVQFADAKEGVLDRINHWTKGLSKAS